MENFTDLSNHYKGPNLVKRIQALIKYNQIPNTDGYTYLLNYCYQNNYHQLYKSIHEEATKAGVSGLSLKKDWLITNEKNLLEQINKKEQELNAYRISNLKQKIQQTYVELAKLYYEAGAMQQFEQTLLKTKEFNTHLPNNEYLYYYKLAMILAGKCDIIKDMLLIKEDLKNLSQDNKIYSSNHRAITAISLIVEKKDLNGAISILLSLSPENLTLIDEYSSMSNLAIYLAVLAVICLKRNEINSKIFNTEVKGILNQNNNALKFLEAFYVADYKEASTNLKSMMICLENDIFMSQNKLYFNDMIIEKMIKQYLLPITKISIEKMASNLGIEKSSLIEILEELIRHKDIPFLIDPVDLILVSKPQKTNTKDAAFKHALKFTTNYVFEKTLTILRFNLVNRRKFISEGSGDIDAKK